MPVYAYKCPVCGYAEEHLKPASRRDEPVTCISCVVEGRSINDMERVSGNINFNFKGGSPTGSETK